MHIQVEFRWIGSFRDNVQKDLEQGARTTIRTFFKHLSSPPKLCIYLRVHRIHFDQDTRSLIKRLPYHVDVGMEPDGVRVRVQTEGKEGIACLMSINGLSSEDLTALIRNGPYDKKDRVVTGESVNDAVVSISDDLGGGENPGPNVLIETDTPATSASGLDTRTPVTTTDTLSSVTELKARLSPREVDKLKTILATVVYRAMAEAGETEIPDTLCVPPSIISAILKEQLRLEGDVRDDYRGVFANFYRSRFPLFAQRCNDPTIKSSQQQPWLVDGSMVRDFVGGAEALKDLAQKHEQAVATLTEHQEQQPTTAGESSANLDFVIQLLLSKKARIEARDRALAEVERCQLAVSAAEMQLANAQSQLALAVAEATKAEDALSNRQHTPQELDRIRQVQQTLRILI